jgi:hypothetical protein
MLKVGDKVEILLSPNEKSFVVYLKSSRNRYIHKGNITISPTLFFVDKEKRSDLINKNIKSTHAWVEGIIVDFDKYDEDKIKCIVNYNPYKFDYFHDTEKNIEYNDKNLNINFQIDTLKGHVIKKQESNNEKIG